MLPVWDCICCLCSLETTKPSVCTTAPLTAGATVSSVCHHLTQDKDTELWKNISAACMLYTLHTIAAYSCDISIKHNFKGEIRNKSPKISLCCFPQVAALAQALEKRAFPLLMNQPMLTLTTILGHRRMDVRRSLVLTAAGTCEILLVEIISFTCLPWKHPLNA